MSIEELEAQVADLSQQLAAAQARANQAESSLEQIRLAARKEAIAQLALKTGREFKPEEAATLEQLEEGAFHVLAAVMSEKIHVDEHLFSAQYTNGAAADPEGKPTLAKMNATLIHQLSGKKE